VYSSSLKLQEEKTVAISFGHHLIPKSKVPLGIFEVCLFLDF